MLNNTTVVESALNESFDPSVDFDETLEPQMKKTRASSEQSIQSSENSQIDNSKGPELNELSDIYANETESDESSETTAERNKMVRPRMKKGRPSRERQLDQTAHYAVINPDSIQKRCKRDRCIYKSRVACDKCKLNVCLNAQRNCFKRFHTEE